MEYVGQKECEPLGDIEQEREGWRKRAIEVAKNVIAPQTSLHKTISTKSKEMMFIMVNEKHILKKYLTI